MSSGRLLGMCGALRVASTNAKLMRAAAAIFEPAEFVEADLRLPLYDGDVEARGIPAEVNALRDAIAWADAVIIATPEYNKSLSGVLKNALDWVSRTKPNPWLGKPVAIMSAAAGRAGGERAQFALRLCLNPFRPHVLPGPEVMLADAQNQFEAERLTNTRTIEGLRELMGDLRGAAGLSAR